MDSITHDDGTTETVIRVYGKPLVVPDSLERDANACLAFLILNQDKWNPKAMIHTDRRATSIPITLIAFTDEKEAVGHGHIYQIPLDSDTKP